MSYYEYPKFDYGSMTDKYKGFTGKEWNYSGGNDTSYLKSFPMVSLEGSSKLVGDMHHTIRDWCQKEFGDRWIYEWNDYYFHNQRDANWFALRWS